MRARRLGRPSREAIALQRGPARPMATVSSGFPSIGVGSAVRRGARASRLERPEGEVVRLFARSTARASARVRSVVEVLALAAEPALAVIKARTGLGGGGVSTAPPSPGDGPAAAQPDKLEIDPVAFAPGSAVIAPSTEAQLIKLAEFLRRSPNIKLTLAPVVTAADIASLKEQEVAARVEALRQAERLPDQAAALRAYYQQKLPDVTLPKTRGRADGAPRRAGAGARGPAGTARRAEDRGDARQSRQDPGHPGGARGGVGAARAVRRPPRPGRGASSSPSSPPTADRPLL